MKIRITGLKKFQTAGQVTSSNPWIRNIFDYEASHGSRTGRGLGNFGYNAPRGYHEDPVTHLFVNDKGELYNGTGNYRAPRTMDEAIAQYEKEYLPSVANYAPGIQERMGDFLYNTGEDGRLYMLDQYLRKYEGMADGLDNRGAYRAGRALNSSFGDKYKEYEAKIAALPMAEQIALLDKGRDYYYQNIDRQNGQPNAAYAATWKPRLGIFGQYKAPATTTQAQATTTQAAKPVTQTTTTAAAPVTAPATQTVTQPVAQTQPVTQPVVQQPAAAAPVFTYNTGVLNQNQNSSGLNMPFTIAAQPLAPIPSAKKSQAATTQAAAPVAGTTGTATQITATPTTAGTYNWQNPFPDTSLALKKTVVKADGTTETTGNVGEGYTVYEQNKAGTPTQASNVKITKRTGDPDFFNKAQDRLMDQLVNPNSGLNQLGMIDSVTKMITNPGRQRAENMRLMDMNAGYNRQGTTALDRGNYGVGPTDYGLFRPNQQGVDSPEGQYNGGRFFQIGGTNYEVEQYQVPSIDAIVGSTVVNPFEFAQQPEFAPQGNFYQAPEQEDVNVGPASQSFKEQIALRESGGNYKALPKKKDGTLASSAVGKYQFLWNYHNKTIQQVTGVKTKEEFMNNPDAQEQYFDYWDKTVLTPYAKRIMQTYRPDQTADEVKMMIHFTGPQGALDWYGKGKVTTDAFGTNNMSYLNKIRTKSKNVNISNLQPAIAAFTADMSSRFPGLVVSSGNDSDQHKKGSRHYENKAVDIGANSSDRTAYQGLKRFISSNPQLKQRYGIEDIIDEGDHIHVELYKAGGEYELTAEQIMQIKAMGGDVEFI